MYKGLVSFGNKHNKNINQRCPCVSKHTILINVVNQQFSLTMLINTASVDCL